MKQETMMLGVPGKAGAPQRWCQFPGAWSGAGSGAQLLAVRVPERPAAPSPRPRVLPGAGQPRARRMDGRRRRRPAPVLHRLRCARFRVGLRGRPAARARGELCSECEAGRAALRAACVPPPPPARGPPLSPGAARTAPWRSPREAPAPDPAPSPRGVPARMRATAPMVPREQLSSRRGEGSGDRGNEGRSLEPGRRAARGPDWPSKRKKCDQEVNQLRPDGGRL